MADAPAKPEPPPRGPPHSFSTPIWGCLSKPYGSPKRCARPRAARPSTAPARPGVDDEYTRRARAKNQAAWCAAAPASPTARRSPSSRPAGAVEPPPRRAAAFPQPPRPARPQPSWWPSRRRSFCLAGSKNAPCCLYMLSTFCLGHCDPIFGCGAAQRQPPVQHAAATETDVRDGPCAAAAAPRICARPNPPQHSLRRPVRPLSPRLRVPQPCQSAHYRGGTTTPAQPARGDRAAGGLAADSRGPCSAAAIAACSDDVAAGGLCAVRRGLMCGG